MIETILITLLGGATSGLIAYAFILKNRNSFNKEIDELKEKQRRTNEFQYYSHKLTEVGETKYGDYPDWDRYDKRGHSITATFNLTQEDIDFLCSDYDGHIIYLKGVHYFKPKEFSKEPGIQTLTFSTKR